MKRMDKVATASINTFGISPKADFESPAESIISTGQLQAILEAIRDLKEEIAQLQADRDQDRREIAALRASVASLETRQEADVNRVCLDICQDRQRLARLETRPSAPTPTMPRGEKTVARIAKVKDFLKARGGGATFQECERLLAIKPNQMTKLVSQLDKRSFEVFTRNGDGRQRVLRLKCFT